MGDKGVKKKKKWDRQPTHYSVCGFKIWLADGNMSDVLMQKYEKDLSPEKNKGKSVWIGRIRREKRSGKERKREEGAKRKDNSRKNIFDDDETFRFE